jgi:TonB family protein
MSKRTLVLAFAVLVCLRGRMALTAQGNTGTPTPTPPNPNVPPAPSPTATCKKAQAPVLIQKVDPKYPTALREQRVGGTVILQGFVTTDGTVEEIGVVESPSNDLTEGAIASFRTWRYRPAQCDGKPIRVYVRATMTFNPGKKKS